MKSVFLALLLGGLFLFGCTADANPQASPSASITATVAPSTQATATPAASATASVEASASASAQASASASPSASATAEVKMDDLKDKTFDALSALGVSLECDTQVTDKETGYNVKSKVYIKGTKLHAYSTVQGTDTMVDGKPLEVIATEKMAYTKLDSLGIGSGDTNGCQWLSVDLEAAKASASQTPSTGASSAADADALRDTDVKYSCKPGIFGDEMFQVPAGQKVCSTDEYIKAMTAGITSGSGLPAGYPSGMPA